MTQVVQRPPNSEAGGQASCMAFTAPPLRRSTPDPSHLAAVPVALGRQSHQVVAALSNNAESTPLITRSSHEAQAFARSAVQAAAALPEPDLWVGGDVVRRDVFRSIGWR